MKKLSFTSGAFTGEVILTFNELGFLVSYDALSAQLTPDQQKWFLQKLPCELAEVERVLAGSPTAKLTEISLDITFDMFWSRYNDKVRSSRKKAMLKWIRMSNSDRTKAYHFISKYEMNIPQGVSRKYAETYLNNELWNN